MPEQDPTASPADVVVLGAGIAGLTSALTLAEAGHRVRVWSADDPTATTSAHAGGVWKPTYQAPLAGSLARAARSLEEYLRLAALPGTGVRMVDSVTVGEVPDRDALPAQLRLLPALSPEPPAELPAGFDRGLRHRSPIVDLPRHVGWLVDRLTELGGKVETRHVESVDEPLGQADVVVVAAGLGSRELADDPTVRPLFSQYVVTDNPGITQLLVEISDSRRWTSIIPHDDRVHLGGVRVPGRTDATPDREEAREILHRCREAEPRLRDARVLRIDTGILPSRPTTRVEAEHRGDGLVVHNYGHGGSGLSLCWGTAHEVVRLVAERDPAADRSRAR
ncbi:FAD-binding oxidoreductase [Actinomycetospora endophytica]|uniref:D-amino-acid oxidase n=1 Tax=Actinomycetospora endophytica TaxID=2291215 RepID=A0ABS8PB35_9PSEU|nr:FAD-dependent oxidoreductase [Actinomycetospora endophytica]MCD2195490.1 FAD-binding oxidoreductase [Actinomycetospora endophytica]